jgi:peptide chain release factor subunit 1
LIASTLITSELIATTDVPELRTERASNSAVISLYLNVPVDIAEHRGLLIRARDLIKAAVDATPAGQATATETDIGSIIAAIDARSLDWLGHTVALFACAEQGLFQAMRLSGHTDDRAVLAHRPYLRPLLAARQRNPAYQVAVIDAEHAWILAVTGTDTDTLAERTGPAVPSSAFAGWHGLDGYRVQQRAIQRRRKHYRDTISTLARTTEDAKHPIVLGGHEMQISRFVAMLPHTVRQRVAGSFNIDWQTATPARVRELAAPVIADWIRSAEAKLVDEVLSEPPNTAVTTSLAGCVTAVRSRAVSQLLLADDQVVPGCACDNCGAAGIGDAGCDCTDGRCRPVPDLLDVLAGQALDGGSQVAAVREAPFTAAAKLRFAVS